MNSLSKVSPLNPFSFRTLSLAIRPPRFVLLINEDVRDWQNTMVRIIACLSNYWGGSYNLVVPTNGKKINEEFWDLMKQFDPDYIYRYQKTMLDVKSSNPTEYNKWLDAETDKIIEKKDFGFTYDEARKNIDEEAGEIDIESVEISEELERELKKRLNQFEEEIIPQIYSDRPLGFPLTLLSTAIKGMNVRQRIYSPEMVGDKDFCLCLYSILGKLEGDLLVDGPREEAVYYDSFIHEYNEDRMHELIQIALNRTETFWNMPFPKSLLGITLYSTAWPASIDPVVIIGDSLNDFCLYYNLSRMNRSTYWLPMSILKSYYEQKVTQHKSMIHTGQYSYPYWLKERIRDIIRRKKDKEVLLYSSSVQADKLDLVIRLFEESAVRLYPKSSKLIPKVQDKPDGLLQTIERAYEEDMPKRTYIEQFYNGESTNFLNTPLPRKFPKIQPGHNWITEVSIENYSPPFLKTLAVKTVINKNYDNQFVRIGPDGFHYVCPNFLNIHVTGGIESITVRPKLRLYDDFAIFNELFQQGNYHIKYSDKGNYHNESCLKLGGFDELSILLADENKMKFLLKFCDESKSEEGSGIYIDRRRYLWFDEIKSFFGENTRDILDDFVEKGILYRGFIFKCERCRNAAWYDVNEVSNKFNCSRCKTDQVFKRAHWKTPMEEPRWYYKLDEILYLAMKNNMYVPTLTLRKLERDARRGFHYVPEIEIRKDPNSEKPDVEIDFVAVIDGEVYLGEATTEDEFERTKSDETKKLSNLKLLAESIQATKIVLATYSDEWSHRTQNSATEIFRASNCEPLFLTKSDLLLGQDKR